ncbi:MAG: hypothetical protein JWO36_94 [Myxococcales bacterium]|nr:hypothetical protein [Myxococcales bacterium]
MRLVGKVALVLCVLCGVASADDDPLIEEGQGLAKQGEFSHAIQLFKQADAKHSTAAHACLIGLVYTRRELWSQAEIFFDRCHKRATAADPVPDWLNDAETTLVQKLADVDAAAITIHVEPELAATRVTVLSFADDEQFEPRTIHLAPGTYVVTATAPGREPAHVTLLVVPKVTQIVTLVLPPPPPPPPPPPSARTVWGTRMLYGAAVAAGVGVLCHALASKESGELQLAHDAHDPVAWDQHARSFETLRAFAIGGYAVAVGAAVTGFLLRHHHERAPIVGGTVGAGTAMVTVGWQR